MMINYDNLKITLKNALVHGVVNFRYVVATRTFADIEVLDFGNQFGSQARIYSEETEHSSISSGRLHKTLEDALNDIIVLIEKDLLEDDYVRKCQNLL